MSYLWRDKTPPDGMSPDGGVKSWQDASEELPVREASDWRIPPEAILIAVLIALSAINAIYLLLGK